MSAKNYDPPTHTTEHILNRLMVNKYSCGRSVSSHIEKKKSKCDYKLDHDLTSDEILQIESEMNKLLRSNMDVKITFAPKDEVPEEADLSKLPNEALQNEIRLVWIGDFDVCACIGPHVSNTSEIKGKFKICTSSFQNGIMRLRWNVK
jgi:Ser-tRNA(Ala) deacylase AlaX